MFEIQEINKLVEQYIYFEFEIKSFINGNLILIGGEDLSYFHNIEITFHEVHTISCNTSFIVEPSSPFLFLISEDPESYEVNIKFGVIKGNYVYKFLSEDGVPFYVAAKSMSFQDKVVKH